MTTALLHGRSWRAIAVLPMLLLLSGCGDSAADYHPDAQRVAALREALAAAAPDEVEVTVDESFQHDGGYVTIRGRFVLESEAAIPRPASILDRINRDQAVCAPGGRDVFSQQLLINAQNRGIENIVIYVEVEPGRDVPIHESAAEPAEEVVSDQRDCVFIPHVLVVHTGQETLTLKNSEPVASGVSHNANIAARRGRTVNPLIPAGGQATYELTAQEASPVPITCTVHPWMRGYIMPRDNGYFAVTDRDGNFEIRNVPSGDALTFKVWHEAAGRRAGTEGFLPIPSIEGVQPVRDGFSITLSQETPEQELNFEIPRTAFWVQ